MSQCSRNGPPCSLAYTYQRFGGTLCLHLQGRRLQYHVRLEHPYLRTKQHDVTSHWTVILISYYVHQSLLHDSSLSPCPLRGSSANHTVLHWTSVAEHNTDCISHFKLVFLVPNLF